MKEERSEHEALNEAALEQVSGGSDLPNSPIGRATRLCGNCIYRRHGRCSGRSGELADYMRKNGLIDDVSACPFKP